MTIPLARIQCCGSVHRTSLLPAVATATATAVEGEVTASSTAATGSRGGGSRSGPAKVFKLVQVAEKKWRLLNGSQLIPDVIQGVRFINGEREAQNAA
ncbi:MAG: hypothetical protein FJ276_16405 [Planctomycetes bacterium]|nr:hypothetical protein [Planctomycetota bacterium]